MNYKTTSYLLRQFHPTAEVMYQHCQKAKHAFYFKVLCVFLAALILCYMAKFSLLFGLVLFGAISFISFIVFLINHPPLTTHQKEWMKAWTKSRKLLINTCHFRQMSKMVKEGMQISDIHQSAAFERLMFKYESLVIAHSILQQYDDLSVFFPVLHQLSSLKIEGYEFDEDFSPQGITLPG